MTRIASRSALLTAPPALALLLVGCTAEPDGAPSAVPTVTVTAAASTSAAPSATPSASATGSSLPLARIAAAAQREAGSGTVVSVDEDGAGQPWDVVVVASDGTERELRLGVDGRVLAGPTTDGTDADDRTENRRLVAASRTDIAEAAATALDTAGGGRLTELSLDESDGGAAEWEADVEGSPNGVRGVRITAADGQVVPGDSA